MKVSSIGLDIAKNVFHLVGQNKAGREVLKKRLRRSQVLRFFAQHERCRVGIEACGGSHYWAREFEELGHEVGLIPAQVVKAYVPGTKHDYNDARGICEALSRPGVRTVAVKSVGQQDIQALHRVRRVTMDTRKALANQMRGLLAEYGIVIGKGLPALRRGIPEVLEDAENGLSEAFRALLGGQYEELRHLDERMGEHDRQLKRLQRNHEPARRLSEVPGIGPIVSTAALAHLGNGSAYRNGRGFAACIGLVPRQYTTGGKPVLMGISKRGDAYLRTQFIHGARSVLSRAPGKHDRLSRWAVQLQARRGHNIATVALANKLARISWALLAHGERFDPKRA